MPPRLPLRRARRRGRALVPALAALILASCGGSDGTAPPDGGSSGSLVFDASTAHPREVVVARVRGALVTTSAVPGSVGAVATSAARLDDSTVALTVPAGVDGQQTVTLVVGGRELTGTLGVQAAPAVADPTAYVDGAVASAVAELDAVLDSLRATGSADTVAMLAVRGAIADAEAQLAAATPAERAEVAAFLAANAAALGLAAPGQAVTALGVAPPSLAVAATGACRDEDGNELSTYEQCMAQLGAFMEDHVRRAVRIAALGVVASSAAAVGGPAGILVSGVTLALTLNEISVIYHDAMRRFITPVFKALVPTAQADQQRAALAVAPSVVVRREAAAGDGATGAPAANVAPSATPTFTAGVSAPYELLATYESPTGATAAANPTLAAALAALDAIREAWNDLARVLELESSLAVPATPARSVVAPVPGAYLSLGAIAPSTITGSSGVVDGAWRVAFASPGIGNDRPFTFVVNYQGPGMTQPAATTVSAVLQPSGYPVAAVLVSPAQPTVERGGTVTLAAEVRDSAARVLDDRPVRWTSSNGARARVDSLTGVVTGVDTGTVTITATAEGVAGSVTLRVTPVLFTPASLAIGATAQHTCVAATDGRAYCWGTNNAGQLGDGTRNSAFDEAAPRAVAGSQNWATVVAGGFYSCGLTTIGDAYCWGENRNGQLGIGQADTLPSTTPRAVSGVARFAQLFPGWETTCALTGGGSAYCWGWNVNGEMGNGTAGYERGSATPTPVSGGLAFQSLTMGENHVCGLSGSTAYCWGSNRDGQQGDTAFSTRRLTPTAVPTSHRFSQLAAGNTFTCGLTTTGATVCWGNGSAGVVPPTPNRNGTLPTVIAGAPQFVNLAAGAQHACGLTVDGSAWCWGWNLDGQLGDGTRTDRSSPVKVLGGLAFERITAGFDSTCGLTRGGQLYCWGETPGDGSYISEVPRAVTQP